MSRILRTYILEMHRRPETVWPALPPGVSFVTNSQLSPELYRHLYRQIGERWGWRSRLEWSLEQVRDHLNSGNSDVCVLYQNNEPTGYVEYDLDRSDEIRIKYFGLIPRYFGRGLGKLLAQCAIEHAWSRSPRRLWLETSTTDHPHALPLYLRYGFAIAATKTNTETEAAGARRPY